MKRYICIFLCAALVFTATLTPASAAELQFIDMLPILEATSHDMDLNYIWLSDGHAEFSFNDFVQTAFNISYIDMLLVTYDNGVLGDFWICGVLFEPQLIGTQHNSNYYRIIEQLDEPIVIQIGDCLEFSVYGSLDCSFAIEKFLISQSPVVEFSLTGSSALYSGGTLQATGSIPGEIRRAVSSGTTTAPRSFVYSINDSKLYDYIDLIIEFQYFHISSIVIEAGDQIVDYELSYLSDPVPDDFYYYISLSIDMTGIDRTDLGALDIRIDGYLDNYDISDDAYIYSKVWSCVGLLEPSTKDATSSWFTRFSSLLTSIRVQITNIWYDLGDLIQKSESFFSSVLDRFQGVILWLDDIYTVMDDYLFSIYNWLERQYIEYNDSWFGELGDHIYTLIDEMNTELDRLGDRIQEYLAIEDSKENDVFQENIENQDEEFREISGALDAVEKPDAALVTGDVSNVVDFSQVTTLTAPIVVMFGNPLIFNIFMLSFILMLGSYVLFGKR